MTTMTRDSLSMAVADGVRIHETSQGVGRDDDTVQTRDDWPRVEFLTWLDAIKRNLGAGSDYQLAQRLGIGHTLISGWRSGRQRPSVQKLNIIAERLGEDPRRLWVLAGCADAAVIGLLDDDGPSTTYVVPNEIQRLLDLYNDRRLSQDDRDILLRHLAIVATGLEVDLTDDRKNSTTIA